MVTLDIRLTTQFPLTSKELLAGHNHLASTLNLAAGKVFENYLQEFTYAQALPTFAAAKQESFADLTKILEEYRKSRQTGYYLTGAIILACLVGVVAQPILGFAALGAALTAAFAYYPKDQGSVPALLITSLQQCEINAAIVEILDGYKMALTEKHAKFAEVEEPFYSNLYRIELDYPNRMTREQRLKCITEAAETHLQCQIDPQVLTPQTLKGVVVLYQMINKDMYDYPL